MAVSDFVANFTGGRPIALEHKLAELPAESCPACGETGMRTLFSATDRLYQTTDKNFYVVECTGCRLMRLFPQPTPMELGQYYPEEYWYAPADDSVTHIEEMYRRIVLRDHVNFVEKAIAHSGTEGNVLDVGCGGGLFLALMRERGHKGIGLDFSLNAAAMAWERFAVPAICATLTRVPLPDASCKTITMFHVLEHLYDPMAYLEAAHRLLTPGGRLVVQVPNAACWQFLLFGKDWNGVDVPRHLINFRDTELISLLEHCGFEVVRRKYFSLRDNPAGLASSIAPDLDPMARKVRGVKESPRLKLFKNLVYFCMVLAAVPVTALEAACRAGSTLMVEARKKA